MTAPGEAAARGSAIMGPRPVLGASAMLMNTLLIPFLGVAIRRLAEDGVATLDMLVWRSVMVIAILAPLLAWPGNLRAVLRADLRAHAIHAGFTIGSMACFYFALRTLPLVTVTAISFTTPFFALLLARLLYGDRVSARGWAALIVGFAGTLVVLRPEASGIGLDAAVVLFGSLLGAGMALAIRRIPARSSNYASIFYLSLFGAVLYLALGATAGTALPQADQMGYVLALSGIALGVHFCVILAYRFAPSMLVGALDYFRVVTAMAVGFVILGERPDAVDLAGIALIVGSGVLILRSQVRPPVA